MRKLTRAILAFMITGGMISALSFPATAEEAQIMVTNTDELTAALKNAKAGDEIILRAGTYQPAENNGSWRPFQAAADGTADRHIILRSEEPDDPATIRCLTPQSKCALSITGSYWEIRDLKISTAAKGIFLAKSEHSVISGCEVFDIGEEAVHIIDDSSYNLIENCLIHDTGLYTPKYGEGVYIGSAKNATDYGFECHFNTVRNCQFGPNIAADHVDIKEFTHGNVVEYCTFDGTGIQGENGGNSFVEIKGNDAIVRYNTGYRNGCEKQLYGFDMNVQLDGWGQNNKIYDNTLYLDTDDCLIAKGWKCYTEVFRNTVAPAACAYDGNRVLEVLGYRLTGDVNEDGMLDRTDAEFLLQILCCNEVPHFSPENSDLNSDGRLNAADLTLLKQKLLRNDTNEKPQIYVNFKKESAGKWRMSNGLGEKTVTFRVGAEPGMKLNMGWGCWDPYYVDTETGKEGKWIQLSLGTVRPNDDGTAEISVELPPDATSVALEVYSCSDDSGKREKDDVRLIDVRTN